jgi:hypothetical protein
MTIIQKIAEITTFYVSPNRTDLCVMCGKDTGIPTATPIDERTGYVEGCGQCCAECAKDTK